MNSALPLLSSAWQELRVHRVRSLLAGLSVVIGVAALVAVVAMGDLGRAAVQEQVERTVGRPATLSVHLTADGEQTASRSSVDGNAAWIRQLGVRALSRVEARQAQLGAVSSSPVPPLGVTVMGVDAAYGAVKRMDLVAGQWLPEGKAEPWAPPLYLNAEAAEHFGVDHKALGSRLSIEADTQTRGIVLGIVDDSRNEPVAYTDIRSLRKWYSESTAPETAEILLTIAPSEAEYVTSAVLHHLASAGLTGSERVQRVDDFSAYERILKLLQAVLGAIAGISLVTGGIGLMNLTLSQIQSRVHEFGVRRAFGASQSHIFAIILWESVILTAVSSLLGTLLSAGVFNAALFMVPDFSGGIQFPVTAALIGSTAAIFIGVFSALVPALRAARLDIIRAIRT
ncbi:MULTISPECIES: ABC transporter permease [unclassified Streptomyces]|uniref:ABC transporter permease n=1 Tax=unclassified Streptomyces TaxID=2593676 RepID=UPI0023650D67|nr:MULTISPECIES: ABC transporter permease [unclassified Streptomyces]MDF3142544.1 ABC transporter permease [Streptomyces sp. T21Q-yed]WDF38288.1 ABC transporter permease [Streptomyces sp. T12]